MNSVVISDNDDFKVYRTSRVKEKLTQKRASELLNISAKQLSTYERGLTKVPDDVARCMSRLYHNPAIVWMRLGVVEPSGEGTQGVVIPESASDMAFQLILAHDRLSPIVEKVKSSVNYGRVADRKRHDYEVAMNELKQVVSQLLSVSFYAG